ncbi:hypothetical protein MANES_01G029950v8 [Manihot esculenta]|uniref:Uncharacterized protein n=1 Tax=Manihot esculenta TaxID=3983 RepID=A0ACB7IA09_MANES|nr:hypothetical protein MANES_01G029950v8 [Manihot esculenta]
MKKIKTDHETNKSSLAVRKTKQQSQENKQKILKEETKTPQHTVVDLDLRTLFLLPYLFLFPQSFSLILLLFPPLPFFFCSKFLVVVSAFLKSNFLIRN